MAVPVWAPGPPAQCTRSITCVSPYDLQALTLYLAAVCTPTLEVRSLKDLPCLSYNPVSVGVILRNQGWIFESLIRTECSLVSFLFSTPPPLSPQQDSFAPMQIKSKQILGRRDPTNSTTIKIQAWNANGLFRVGIVMEPFYHHVWVPYFLHLSIKEVKMLLLNSRLWRLKNSASLLLQFAIIEAEDYVKMWLWNYQ